MSDNKTQGKTGGKALLIVFGIIAALVYMWHMGAVDDAKHIEAVLAQDKALSATFSNRVSAQKTDSMEDFDQLAGYFDDFVEGARKIDTSLCPRDFAEAYARYVSAYSEEGMALHGHPRIPSGEEAFAAGFLKGLQGDPTDELREISDSISSWQRRWHEESDQATQAERQMREVAIRYELYSWPR
jgi:hypothetical protein